MPRHPLRLLLPGLSLAMLLLGSGCILQSLHPLYAEADTLFDPALVGAWTDADAAQRWEFAPLADDGSPDYRVAYTEDGHTAAFTGRLVELGGLRLLDVCPAAGGEGNTLDALLRVPVHTCWRVELAGDVLSFRFVDIDWLGRYLADHPQEVAHVWQSGELDGLPLLTAETAELRAFVERHVHDPGFWGNPADLQRAAAAPAQAEEARPD